MSGYDDPYAWERMESYLAGIQEFSKPRPCSCSYHKRLAELEADRDQPEDAEPGSAA